MKSTYSEAFIEQALVKVFSRGSHTIRETSQGLNVPYHTLKHWMQRKTMAKRGVSATKERRPADWSAQEQLVALHETYGLDAQALQAWCRERGLFEHHLTGWQTAFCSEARGSGSGQREWRTLKDENDQLKRELTRKEKALAEAAALLVLQKKFRALWEDEAK
ncbi:MAG: transposase [Burkholderiales bacterium 21-58-4]|nr:MAG: transposase [Burkholderiales bacterium 21-58-4]